MTQNNDNIKRVDGGVCAAKGFFANGIYAGIKKKKEKKDLGVIYSKSICSAAAVYTKNKVCGANIIVSKEHLKNGQAKAIICNSGNANTCNKDGVEVAKEMCKYTAMHLNIDEQDVVVASTGVIGMSLPIDPIKNNLRTLIDNAQNFGLSDLHQMRGRVGRSNKKAYCYLIAPPLSLLPDDSRRRLEAIENFSDLGSGINIAMQDLDIRGAGNLLGAEQSGFIADLGYDTYQKILNEAVVELKTQEFTDLYEEEINNKSIDHGDLYVTECTIESDLQMCFPESYVPGSSERILLYRELDSIDNDIELEAYRKRLEDRFGTPPSQAEELMRVVTLRRYGKKLGVEKILLKSGIMLLFFVSDKNSPFYKSATFSKVIDYAMHHIRTCKLEEVNSKRRMQIQNINSVSKATDALKEMLVVQN